MVDTGQCLPTAPAGEGGAWECTEGSPEPATTDTAAGRQSGALLQAWPGQNPRRLLLSGSGWRPEASLCRSLLVLAFPAPSQEPPGGSDLGRERGRRRGPGHSQCGAPGEVPAAVTPASSLRRPGNCSWSAGSFLLLLAGSGLGPLSQETAQERDFFSSCKTTALSKSAALYFKKGKRRFTAGHRRLLVAVV